MYLYSMPLYEARRLASYDRYFNSMKIYIGLLVLAWFISLYRSNKLYIGLSLTILVAICILDNARLGQALVPADRLAHDVDMYRYKEVIEHKIGDNIKIKRYDKNNFADRKALAASLRNEGLVIVLR